MAKTLSTFLLLLASLPWVQAIPANGPVQLPLHEISTTRPSTSSSPFRRLRDAIIEKIWDVPKRSRAKQCMNIQSLAPANYRARYGADVVLRFHFKTDEEIQALSDAIDILYLDVWEITNEWVDVRIAKDVVPSLLGLLPESLHHAHAPIMHDLAQAVYDTYPTPPENDNVKSWSSLPSPQQQNLETDGPHDLFFDEYQPLSVLYPWLRLMASMFPSHASLESIGLSAEGRDIPALRVGARTDLPPDHKHPTRQTILVVGGSHAREWVSVSTAAYIAYSLITRYGDPRFPDTTKLLDHFDVTFLPTINPDGYEYTWTTDRLWRKNRQETPLPFCAGIDIDRSFPFGWDGGDDLDNPCSEDFAGGQPLAATEARQLTEWAKIQTESNITFVAFLDLHSYSQKVLYPYSYTCDIDPPNLEDLEEVAIGLAKSFRLTNGHYYGVNSACEGSISLDGQQTSERKVKFPRGLVELQGGSALDYFYHELRVKYSYQIKLRDTGSYGFLLPTEHIVPTGNEAFEAVLGMGRWLLGNHGIEKFNEEL